MSTGFLKVQGTKIVDGNGSPVILKGTANGGHLNMENFISGYPGCETEHRKVLLKKMGKEKYDFFFDKFLEYFWTEKDAIFFKEELGMNCLRIPFNYHHFIDDEGDLFEIDPKGFERLDAIVNTCAKHGIYTILDLHTAPGGQMQAWPCDSGLHKALFWDFKVFQDSMVNLWEKLAEYYKDNTWVAGYNPLNEPACSNGDKLTAFYDRIVGAIRDIDPDHILFLDGNNYARDFTCFKKVYPNSVYAIHDYTGYGFPNPEKKLYSGKPEEKAKIAAQYQEKIEYMVDNQVPVWCGEFGPVYSSKERQDENIEETNESRISVLEQQLEVYKKGDPSGDETPISWSIWVYKDLGYQGLAYVDPQSKFYEVLGEFLVQKKKLGLDQWGCDMDPKYAKVYDDLADHMTAVIPEKYHNALYPHGWGLKHFYLPQVTRHMLLSQYFQHVYADIIAELSFEELDQFAACFKIENCVKREKLNAILKKY